MDFTLFDRLFIRPFYARNAGTLLVVMLLAFGFMRPADHEALITATLGSPLLLGLVGLGWALYGLKTGAFVSAQLTAPENRFLQAFRLRPRAHRLLVWAWVQAGLLLPVLGYAGWMLARAAHYRQWYAGVVLVAYVLGLLGVGTLAADYRLHHPAAGRWRLPVLRLQLPYLLFFPAHWLRHEPLSLVLTKAFSGLLLVGVCRIYPTDDYDERLLLLGLLLAVLGHGQVGGQLSQFEQRYLLMLPNLPFSRWQRLLRYTALYGLLWLPEALLLGWNCPTAVPRSYVCWLWLTGWVWLLVLHGLAYGRPPNPERWLARVFGAFVVGLVLIMYGMPVGVWLALGTGLAALLNAPARRT